MLTLREQALSAYNVAASLGNARVIGGDMVEVRAERLRTTRRAQHLVRAAVGTDRYSLREPDDATLRAMLGRLEPDDAA